MLSCSETILIFTQIISIVGKEKIFSSYSDNRNSEGKESEVGAFHQIFPLEVTPKLSNKDCVCGKGYRTFLMGVQQRKKEERERMERQCTLQQAKLKFPLGRSF